MLRTCGTVMESDGEYAVVEVAQESCAECNHHCIRFGAASSQIKVKSRLVSGSRVELRASTFGLMLACLCVLGLPLATLVLCVGSELHLALTLLVTALAFVVGGTLVRLPVVHTHLWIDALAIGDP